MIMELLQEEEQSELGMFSLYLHIPPGLLSYIANVHNYIFVSKSVDFKCENNISEIGVTLINIVIQ